MRRGTTPPQEHAGRCGVSEEPPDFPMDVGAARGPPGTFRQPGTCRARQTVTRRGQDPALQRGGNAAANPVRLRQGKLARAAYTPPLRSAGDRQFILFVRGLRKVVGRGLDPAAGTFRKVRCGRIVKPLRPLHGLGRVAVDASCCAPWSGACILRPLPLAPSRCIRRRRRSTPQPLKGSL